MSTKNLPTVTTNENEPHEVAKDSLKKLSIRGVAWTLGGHGAGEVIRLASNLILTRLLIPEDFGVMLMVNVVIMGLQQFSDIGIGPSIIQNPRGTEQRFLDTTWTIQVIRGGMLWLAATILAHPLAQLYDMPKLVELIPVAATTAIISGFNSTNLFTLNRKLHLGKLTILEIMQSIISVFVMIVWAYFSPSTWALVAGSIVGVLFRMIASHLFLPGQYNRFAWDRNVLTDLFSFGKWIFISTAIGFFANRGDRLILGKVMTEAELGTLSIALVLSQSLLVLISKIGAKVLFPLYSRLAKSNPTRLRYQISRIRCVLMATIIPIMCSLVVWGSDIINLLWDSRYQGAGWMLQVLAVGGIIRSINNTMGPILLAMGDSFRHFIKAASNAVILFTSMGIGIWVNGATGAIIGISVAPLFDYIVLAILIRRYNVLMPGIDSIAVAGSIILISAGFYITM